MSADRWASHRCDEALGRRAMCAKCCTLWPCDVVTLLAERDAYASEADIERRQRRAYQAQIDRIRSADEMADAMLTSEQELDEVRAERDEAVSRAERLEAALGGLGVVAEELHAANAYDSGCDRDGPCPTSQVIRAALAALGSPEEAPK